MYSRNNCNAFILALSFHVLILTSLALYKIHPNIETDNQIELWDENSLEAFHINEINKNKAQNKEQIPPAPKILKINPVSATPILRTNVNNLVQPRLKLIEKVEKSEKSQKIHISAKHKEDQNADIAHNNKNKFIAKTKQIEKEQPVKKPIIDKLLKQTPITKKELKPESKMQPKPHKTQPPMVKQHEKIEQKYTVKPVPKIMPENPKNTAEEIRQANLARLRQNSNKDNIMPIPQQAHRENIINKSNTNLETSAKNDNQASGLSASYKAKIQNIIKRHIKYNGNSGTAAVISLRIDARGNILLKSLAKSSGNSGWDNSALKAVEDAEPFPAPENGETTTMTLRITAD